MTVRPEDLARDLGVSDKRLRAWLRVRYPRSPAETKQHWYLTEAQVQAARVQFGGSVSKISRVRAAQPGAAAFPGGRTASDEHYVIDLCDEILGERAVRGKRFPWLRGDVGMTLPVDAFYEHHRLVVEYRERQHAESIRHFDKPDVMTVSGVHRGEQRKLYDRRREEEIPKHGLRLFIVTPWDLDADIRGRLRRSRVHDMEVLRRLLRDF